MANKIIPLKGGSFKRLPLLKFRSIFVQKLKSLKLKNSFLVLFCDKQGKFNFDVISNSFDTHIKKEKNVMIGLNDNFGGPFKTLQYLLCINLTIFPGITDIAETRIVT